MMHIGRSLAARYRVRAAMPHLTHADPLIWRPWAAALATVLLVLLTEQIIERLEVNTAVQRERARVQETLSTLRARLEGVINANRLLVHGLKAVISTQPDLDQAGFERIARGLVNERIALRHIAAAPDLVISLIYPRAGNEAALGMDYRTHPTQGPAVWRAIESGEAVVAGPLPLAQGGLGIVAREPVFLAPDRPGVQPRLWGLVSAVIDADVLYRLAGLDRPAPGLRLGLRGTDASGAQGPVFFGDLRVYTQSPVTAEVSLPGGSWQLAAAPAVGWGQTDTGRRAIRLAGLLIALACAAAVLWRVRWGLALRAEVEAQRRLAENEARLLEAQCLAHLGNWELDLRTGRLHWSAEVYRIFELSPEQFGASYAAFLDAIHPDDRAAVDAAYSGSVASREPYAITHRLLFADGRIKTVEERGRTYYAADGTPLRSVGTVQDLTDLSQARAGARRGEAVLESVFRTLPDLFFLMDADGTIRDYRARAEDDLYIPAESFLGRCIQNVLPAAVAALFERHLKALVQHGDLVSYEYDLAMPGGERHYEARLTRMPEGTQIIAIVRDVTERKSAEDALHRLNEELEDRVRERTLALEVANKELETFTYSVSHDLKAPLRAIDGYSRLLLDDHLDSLDEEGRLFLGNVRRSVAQMHELIDDLLAYSRMERRTLQSTAVDLATQVRMVLAEREAELAAQGVKTTVDLGGLAVRADPDGLTIALRNLLDNALKFGRDRQPLMIGIHASVANGSVILRIEDNGIGFDNRFQERIFDIFQRLQRAEDYPGTGIGLAIVRKAVQRMGGRVWAEGAAGLGATFYMELPQ